MQNEPQLTVQTGEMKRVKCNGVGDNNGFYEMEVKITQNEPQLSAEIEKRFNDLFKYSLWSDADSLGVDMGDKVKHFLATALEEQKKTILELLDKAEMEKWFDMPDTTENWKTWKKIRNTINREDV